MLNALVAVFDLIRRRTGLDRDGAQLIAKAFSLETPKLVFSNLDTESGKNDQKGFIQILQGAYLGIRNPTRCPRISTSSKLHSTWCCKSLSTPY